MRLIAKGLTTSVLNDCSFAVSGGEVITLQGPLGAGKTLLLRAVADLDPHNGEIWLDDLAQSRTNAPEWRRQVRFVPAEAAWWADEVRAHFRSTSVTREKLGLINLPDESLDWQVARLSTGEKQRLGFLRAIEDYPSVLLLDEPTAALDAEAERAVETLIQSIRKEGAAVLLVTHSEAQADRLADRRYIIEDGQLRENI